jgi:small subunit ribosomal protein S7
MARRKAAAKRVILPDPLFKSEVIAKFMNVVMRRGKKAVAEKIVYGALEELFKHKKKAAKETSEGEAGGSESGSGAGVIQGGIFVSAEARVFAQEMFEKGLAATQPTVEVKSRRVGGATYQIPVEVRSDRRIALAMRWLVEAALARIEKTMALRLANEILDAINGKGGAIKKREDMHRMAKANQAFAHYRW